MEWKALLDDDAADDALRVALGHIDSVPLDVDEVKAWCYLKLVASSRTRYYVLYLKTLQPLEPEKVTLRLYGFIERASLGVLGSWNG